MLCRTCKKTRTIPVNDSHPRRRLECEDCYNRNGKLQCHTCPPDVLETCKAYVALRLPTVCEEWDEWEWSRAGFPKEWMENDKDDIIRGVQAGLAD